MRHSLKVQAALVALPFAVFMAGTVTGLAQSPSTNRPWAYLLLEGSSLVDDCLLCDRVAVEEPMRGTFALRLIEQTQIGARYAVEDINCGAGTRPYVVKGSGTFEFGGEVALRQQMLLRLEIDDGASNKLCWFTNTSSAVNRAWPMIDISLDQTNGTAGQVYHLRLASAPVREIWFSTVTGFTSAHGQPPSNHISPGDLVSFSGRVVQRNSDLLQRFGIMPVAPDLGLDAVDILPGGEIAFSIEQNTVSETLGPIQQGDLLSNKGRILRRNSDLLAPFVPQPASADAGLDAVQVLESGETLFSIETNTYSKRLLVTLQRGDLLSSTGQVWRSNQQLLAKFHPADATKDYGLDAVYVWPQGEEIWFSTEAGFQDLDLGPILPGDLLSDSGYIVFRNLDLLKAFAPLENVADFGLDALFIVTDATPPPPPAPALRITSVGTNTSTASIGLTWQGRGRVFQVQRADSLTGPLRPLSPILTDFFFTDFGTLTNYPQTYYLLQQW
jgi:hypothetical protein